MIAIQRFTTSSAYLTAKETVNRVMTKIANCIAEIWNRIRGAITTLFGYTKATPLAPKVHPLITSLQNEVNKYRTGALLTLQEKTSIKQQKALLDKEWDKFVKTWPRNTDHLIVQAQTSGLIDDLVHLTKDEDIFLEKPEEMIPSTQNQFNALTDLVANPIPPNSENLEQEYWNYARLTNQAKRFKENEWNQVIGAKKDKELRVQVEALLNVP